MIVQKTTKELLADSLRELSNQKSVDKITVKEIAKNCGVTAPTFYNHFSDKYKLLAWIYNRELARYYGRLFHDVTWRDAIYYTAAILLENRAFYANALQNTAGLDSFRYATNDFAIDLILERIRQVASAAEVPADIRFYVKFYMRAISEAANDWFLNGSKIPLEVFVDMLAEAMPPPLKPYLMPQEGKAAHS